MADYAVRIELGHRTIAVTEIDGDHRDTGRARGPDIGGGIADHDRIAQVTAGYRDSAAQYLRVRLLHPKSILPADGGEPVGQFELLEQQYRQSFELVGADGEPAAARREFIERFGQSGKGARAVGDVLGIVRDEIRE